jgi:hypothetical protein
LKFNKDTTKTTQTNLNIALSKFPIQSSDSSVSVSATDSGIDLKVNGTSSHHFTDAWGIPSGTK